MGGRRPAAPPSDARIASSVGSTAGASCSPPSIRAASANPRRPISRSGRRTVDRLGEVMAATGTSSKPATDTCAGTSMPSSARRASAPMASGSLAQAIAVNGADPPSRVSTPRAPPSLSKLVWITSRSSNGIPASSRPRRYPASRARATNSVDGPARNAISRWPSATSAATIDAIPASLSTPTSAGPSACGDRWTTAAPSPRIAARCFSISWFDAGSSRPLAAKITPAARIERSSRTYDVSRSASRSELQVITR